MKYRALTAELDYQFGTKAPFLKDSPATVAQAILTRLKLYTDQWFLDKREGLDRAKILGYGTQGTRDRAIKQRILTTPGVLALVDYQSRVDVRNFIVSATVDTIYGRAIINLNEAF